LRDNAAREWITRKKPRLCHPLPASLVFHLKLKRFEYAPDGMDEKLGGTVDVPAEMDVGPCCLADDSGDESQRGEVGRSCRYHLAGAIVHVRGPDTGR